MTTVGVIERDTRSLDYGSHAFSLKAWFQVTGL